MSDITARQQRILEFIAETVRDRGYPPTVREIGEAVGLTSSSSASTPSWRTSSGWGLLHKDPTKPRAMTLADRRLEGDGHLRPLVGRIAAGAPVLATEQVEDYLAVPADFVRSGEHFALRVTGDSMIGAGILDGDMVVVRTQDAADRRRHRRRAAPRARRRRGDRQAPRATTVRA